MSLNDDIRAEQQLQQQQFSENIQRQAASTGGREDIQHEKLQRNDQPRDNYSLVKDHTEDEQSNEESFHSSQSIAEILQDDLQVNGEIQHARQTSNEMHHGQESNGNVAQEDLQSNGVMSKHERQLTRDMSLEELQVSRETYGNVAQEELQSNEVMSQQERPLTREMSLEELQVNRETYQQEQQSSYQQGEPSNDETYQLGIQYNGAMQVQEQHLNAQEDHTLLDQLSHQNPHESQQQQGDSSTQYLDQRTETNHQNSQLQSPNTRNQQHQNLDNLRHHEQHQRQGHQFLSSGALEHQHQAQQRQNHPDSPADVLEQQHQQAPSVLVVQQPIILGRGAYIRRGQPYMYRGVQLGNGRKIGMHCMVILGIFGSMLILLGFVHGINTLQGFICFFLGAVQLGSCFRLCHKAKNDFESLPQDHPDRAAYSAPIVLSRDAREIASNTTTYQLPPGAQILSSMPLQGAQMGLPAYQLPAGAQVISSSTNVDSRVAPSFLHQASSSSSRFSSAHAVRDDKPPSYDEVCKQLGQ